MWGSFIGLIVNGILNVVLIFGLLGAPKMGIRGAAVVIIGNEIGANREDKAI